MTKAQHLKRMTELHELAEKEKRELTEAEQKEFDQHEADIGKLDKQRPRGQLRVLGTPAVDPERTYSLSRLIRRACGDQTVDAGLEVEVAQELARTHHRQPEGILVPLSAFQRAHDTITPSPDTGASLVGIDQRTDLFMRVDDAIFRPPIASQLGVINISTNESKVKIPLMKKTLNAEWIARDGTPSGSQDAEFDSVDVEPLTLAILFEMKRSLVYGIHPDAEALLMADARRAIETALDAAILNGAGPTLEPLGLLGAATASSVSGAMNASNAYDHSQSIRAELEAYLKATDPTLKWCLHPLAVSILRKTPAFTGATYPLVPSGSTTLAERTFVESMALPTPTGTPKKTQGLFGDYSECVAVTFGPAMTLLVNPFADSVYAKGSVLVRGLLDFNVVHRDVKRVLSFDTETLS